MVADLKSEILCGVVFTLINLINCKEPIYQLHNKFAEYYEFPDLPFNNGDLEPYIDKQTVLVHHQGHHAAYTKKLNAALSDWRRDNASWPAGEPIMTILRAHNKIPEKFKSAIVNNGGGYVNHNIYWWTMSPNIYADLRKPPAYLLADIEQNFGSFDLFTGVFTQKALSLFGSGYVWLSRQPDSDMLVISTTANQDSPLSQGLNPILVIDVWEHAYYLKHQNKRQNHISDWWMLVDWERVAELDEWYKVNKPRDEL